MMDMDLTLLSHFTMKRTSAPISPKPFFGINPFHLLHPILTFMLQLFSIYQNDFARCSQFLDKAPFNLKDRLLAGDVVEF